MGDGEGVVQIQQEAVVGQSFRDQALANLVARQLGRGSLGDDDGRGGDFGKGFDRLHGGLHRWPVPATGYGASGHRWAPGSHRSGGPLGRREGRTAQPLTSGLL